LRKGLCAKPDDPPLVVTAKRANLLTLVAVDRSAQRAGLRPGMPLAHARAIAPHLTVIDADPIADDALLTRIADWCERWTPFVALDPPDGLVLDISGCAHLFDGETAMLADILRRLTGQGLEVSGAIAGTAAAARALARSGPGGIVPPGEEPRAVAPLPVGALGLTESDETALKRAGLKTIGALAERPASALAARFGAGLVAALDAVLGRSAPPISPRRPPPSFVTERRFFEPITTDGAIAPVLRALAIDLCRLLERSGLGLRRAEASFFRTDGAVRHIAVETARPLREAGRLQRLFAERLDALADPLDPGFGFDCVRLSALAADPLVATHLSFDGRESDREDLSGLVDRLVARFGRQRVLRLVSQDTHIPEAGAVAVPAIDRPAAPEAFVQVRDAGEPPARPLRLFAKPERIEAIAEIPDGPPVRFRWRGVTHAVARAEGPERIAMEWWRTDDAVPTRDYFRVEDAEGRRFWLYRDGLYGRETSHPRWFVHGLFA
jgi:protein ImuB